MSGNRTVGTTPVQIDDVTKLKGRYCRQIDTGYIYEITDVGRAGVIMYAVDEEGRRHGPETLVTWRLMRAKYSVIIAFDELVPTGDPNG